MCQAKKRETRQSAIGSRLRYVPLTMTPREASEDASDVSGFFRGVRPSLALIRNDVG